MARRRLTLAQAAQEHIDEAKEQAERDKRWAEQMHSNEPPTDGTTPGQPRPTLAEMDAARQEMGERLATRAAATDELPPTDGKMTLTLAPESQARVDATQTADGEMIEDPTLTRLDTPPPAPPPCPWIQSVVNLQEHLQSAHTILWHRVQEGRFQSPAGAEAAIDALNAVAKAISLASRALAQLPLPERPEATQ